MYIERVRLTNIRRFEELILEFDKSARSLVIAGDNGDGKTSILRCIAMGLCDEASASALLRELPGDFVRHGSDEGQIDIFLRDVRGNQFRILTTIRSLHAFESVKQTLYTHDKGWREQEETFPWARIFVVGYGAGVRTIGTSDYSEYFAADAVYPLFNYTVPLQNPELVIRRIIDHVGSRRTDFDGQADADEPWRLRRNEAWTRVRAILGNVLNVNPGGIALTKRGLTISSNKRKRRELNTLGDGYKATTNWVVDFLSWSYLRARRNQPEQAMAIVLIDEVEQHLHPRWQLTILDSIKRTFPRAQLISTTHSPLSFPPAVILQFSP